MREDMKRLLGAICELKDSALEDSILKIEDVEMVVGEKMSMSFDLTVPEQNCMLGRFFNKLSYGSFYDLSIRTSHYSVLGCTQQEYGYFRVGNRDIIFGSGTTVITNHGYITRLNISISSNDWVDIHFIVDNHTALTMCIPCQ